MKTTLPFATPSSTEPYLSVVVTTRNDDHGGDPLTRLQAFVNAFDEQCRRTGLDAEVIIVEWNPPADRPTIDTLLRIPEPSACAYRFIVVPPDLHETLQYADVLPLFQMIAKNVGIRRARGRFVLATNIDIIFSNELIGYLASGQLQPGVIYRVDRHDIESAIPVHAPLDVLMKYCAEHQLRVHARWGSSAVDPEGRFVALPEDIVDGSSVRLGSGWHVREGETATGFYRWATRRAQLHVDPAGARDAAAASLLEIEFEPNPHDPAAPVEIDIVDNEGGMLAGQTLVRRGVFRVPLAASDNARTLELRVHAAPADGPRPPLAVFERRGDMHYVVRSIRLRTLDQIRERETFVYPPQGWHAPLNSLAESHRLGDNVSVVTAPQRWSYCLQYGPLRARRKGIYRFVLRAEILSGGLSLGVMAGHQRFWIPSSVDHVRSTPDDTFSVSVSLEPGDRFWLMLSNDHLDGEGNSRFVVKELSGSEEFGTVTAGSSRPGSGRLDTPAPEQAEVRQDARAAHESSDDDRALTASSKGGVSSRGVSSDARPLLARVAQRKRGRPIEHQLQFPPSGWRASTDHVTLHREQGGADVSVVTEARKWSYCLEYGPLSAPATGAYRFALDCQVAEGGARLGVLSGDRRSWIPAKLSEPIAPDGRTLTTSAQLRSGQPYWLMLYNDHPAGDRESRLRVGQVTAQVDISDPLSTVTRAIRRACGLSTADAKVIVSPPTPAAYAIDRWRAVDARAAAQPEWIDGRLSAATANEKWSYCLEHGPMRAEATGTYQFSLTYVLTSGGIILGALSADRKKWLPSSSREAVAPDTRTVTLTVPLKANRSFWLVVSNNHPDGEGISRFTVQSLTSSFASINRRERRVNAIRAFCTAIEARVTAVGRRVGAAVVASGRQLSTLVPRFARIGAAVVRLRDGVRRRIVNSSPEYQAVQNNCRALEGTVQQLARLRDLDRLFKLLQDRRPEALHLNGCGDFQLMAREHWFELRGYPEFHTFSMNIDGLFSSIACYAGITERVLDSPCHIYHIEHEVGSGWSPEGEAVLRRRIAERGITWIDSTDVFVWSAYMHWLRRPMIFNPSDWGFAASELTERVVGGPPARDAKSRSAGN